MSLLAVGLIVVAAFCHASWNLLAKRSSGEIAFVWLVQVVGALLYGPFALGFMVNSPPDFTPSLFAAAGASALTHMAYFMSLQHGYRGGDLSLVYPVARGTGPALATVGAILVYGERPGALALLGAVLVIIGVLMISISSRRNRARHTEQQRHARRYGLKWGLITGVLIATYSMIDSFSVAQLSIFPLYYLWFSDVTRSILLAPAALRRLDAVKYELRVHRFEVIGVGLLSPLSYLLVLIAMSFTPLSYVAPAREMSILIGTIMGARLLSEEGGRRRILAAALIVGGVVALALG